MFLLWRQRRRPLLVGISRTGWLHPPLLRCRCHRRITLLLLLWRRPLVLGTSRASRLRLTWPCCCFRRRTLVLFLLWRRWRWPVLLSTAVDCVLGFALLLPLCSLLHHRVHLHAPLRQR